MKILPVITKASVMKEATSLFLCFLLLLVSSASAKFLQPGWRDEVHAVWVNGPTHSKQLGGGWPRFDSWGGSNNAQCRVSDPSVRYTGYTSSGGFCKAASNALDENPHLVLYSGNLGMVLDASGGGGAGSGNLFPKFGSTTSIDATPNGNLKASQVYAHLEASSVTASISITCDGVGSSVVQAMPRKDAGGVANFGLVRQGHAVTHVTIDDLEWTTPSTGEKYSMDPLCGLQPQVYPTAFNCLADYGVVEGNGWTHRSCPDKAFPTCLGFQAGVSWGKCHSDPLVKGDQPCSADYGVGGAGPSNPCATTDFPTCTNGKCYADPIKDPSNANCNQNYRAGQSWPCRDANYPTCLGFVQGRSWGKCHLVATNQETCDSDYGTTAGACGTTDYPICNDKNLCSKDSATCFLSKPWMDVTMWGDSIAIHLHWDGSKATTCSGQVQLEAKIGSQTISQTADFSTEKVAKLLLTTGADSQNVQELTDPLADSIITTSTSGARVVERPDFGDVMVEIPGNLARCGYSPCGNILSTVDVTAKNNNPSQIRTVRLSLSRNFFTTYGIAGSRPSAEITGLNVMIWDKATQQPNGIPIHISKNWHGDGTNVYRGSWWTANLMFRLPPQETADLTFAIVYEKFKGIPAWSHAQLSIVGYSNKWLWEEAALGTGGENFVMDPMGSHTRAAITDVRPKLFDGKWKENVGGGDFLLYFGENGAMQYKKELDARLFVNGPNLSRATYTSLSLDGAIESNIEISGTRTDDLVRVFMRVQHKAVRATKFSRLSFFQIGGETYNYHATFQDFVFGDGNGVTHNFARTCSAGTNKASARMYDSVNSGVGVYREALSETGPWWFAMGPNTNPRKYTDNDMVVGDRGLVIRSYDAKFGGNQVSSPSLSVLCDKIELGAPLGLSEMQQGDYVDMHLEFLVLPRPEDFNTALNNSPQSISLRYLSTLGTTWERVQEQASRGISVTSITPGGDITSHYPIRVCVPDDMSVSTDTFRFTVTGKALGFVPIVICNLDSVEIPSGQGLWSKEDGSALYQLLSDETGARQANYDRASNKYELVFNVEIYSDGETDFGFGPDPKTDIPTLSPSLSPTTDSPTVSPSQSPTTLSPTVASSHPSASPTTGSPTKAPTDGPTKAPTNGPTATPTEPPSDKLTDFPTRLPTPKPIVKNPENTLAPTASSNNDLIRVCGRPEGRNDFIPLDIATVDNMELLRNLEGDIAAEGDVVEHKGGIGVVDERCLIQPLPSPSGFGDPHFITWSSKTFDFHGGCDLVFLSNPSFHNGLGMNIHVRTKIKTWWSLIESAVVQIGNTTLEVRGGTNSAMYWLDGRNGQEIQDGQTTLEAACSSSKFVVNFKRINQHQSRVRVDLGDGNAIGLETYQDFVRVNLKAKTGDAFRNALGLMGVFPTGAMVGRDNSTLFEEDDGVAFGREWQVLSSEPMLFHSVDDGAVQHPQECLMPEQTPTETKARRRRLGEALITEEEAAVACARVDPLIHDSCIQDVLATNDLDIVGVY